MGLIAFRPANCLTSPGWPTDARSGGLPPATAVESTWGVLSPAEVYLTLTPGNFFWKAFRTCWKFFCSAPVQMPVHERLPLTAYFRCEAPLAVAANAVREASAAPRTSKEMRDLLTWAP